MSLNESYRSIEAESLGKMYYIGAKRKEYKNRFLVKSLAQGLMTPIRRSFSILRGNASGAADLDEDFWALRDINFTVNAGETVGIIGRNGSGKSTLLKIITRITTPTEGRTITRGRVASLLEVGTGFNPEFTGRENVYLNGSILGMSRAEIDAKFDEIVAFSEVEQFIDTPTKHYSSGMSVRLAFAVAAHLDTDILLVDEVLAVGDIGFQKKCFSRMNTVASEGRTVIMVSHNMQAVARFCDRAILLENGRLVIDGPVKEAISTYLSMNNSSGYMQEWDDIESAPGNDVVKLKRIHVYSDELGEEGLFDVRFPIHIEYEYWALKAGETFTPAFALRDDTDTVAFISGGMHTPEWKEKPREVGVYRSVCTIPGNMLSEGHYTLDIQAHDLSEKRNRHVNFVDLSNALRFTVFDELVGDSSRGTFTGKYPGVVRPILHWHTEKLEEFEQELS